MNLQFIDLKKQYQTIREDVNRRIQQVLDDANYILGKPVAEMESELAQFVGMRHCLSCASGTDALLLALMALGFKAGEEVIVPSFTFVATAEVVALLGGKPVFVDSEERTYNIDAAKIAEKITPKTRGIIVVDIFGQAADYDEINALAKARGLWVIQDGAQSFGAQYKGRRVTAQAPVACTSFFPAKPLGCYGDGGAVFVDDDRLFAVLESLRVHGKGADKYDNVRIGINGRMDTIQAAVIQAKMPQFVKFEIDRRQEVAERYSEKLSDVCITPQVLPHNRSVWAQYCVRVKNRDRVIAQMGKRKIPTAVYYPKPLHLQTAFAHFGHGRGYLPVCERVAEEIMALPMHPYLTPEEQDFVIRGFCESVAAAAH